MFILIDYSFNILRIMFKHFLNNYIFVLLDVIIYDYFIYNTIITHNV